MALILLGLSAWAFAPYLEYRIAPSAFINAELLRLTAPIAGRLTQGLPRKGEFIAQPQKVTLIDSMAPDRRHLLDIERQYAASKDNSELAGKQLDEVMALDAELTKRTELFRAGMVNRLSHEVEEAEAEETAAKPKRGSVLKSVHAWTRLSKQVPRHKFELPRLMQSKRPRRRTAGWPRRAFSVLSAS